MLKCFTTVGLGLAKKPTPTSSSKGLSTLLPICPVPCRSSYLLSESRRLRRRLVQAILLAHGPDQPIGWPSRMHLLVLRHRCYRLHLGSFHLLLAPTLRCPFRPWPRHRSQVRNRPYLHCRMCPRPHPWCPGHAMADVDCIWNCARRCHFRHIWWHQR